MSSLYEAFSTNKKAEVEGIILEYPDCGGAEIRIARAGGENKKFLRAIEKAAKRHRSQIRTDTLGVDTNRRIMQEVYAETVILGWENVTDRDGNPLPFNKENCLQLFQDLPALWDDIVEQANSIALFREHVREESAKN